MQYYLDSLEKFINERAKSKKDECLLFKEDVAKCFGYKCTYDHSSQLFDEIYKIAKKHQKFLSKLTVYKDYYPRLEFPVEKRNTRCLFRLKCKKIGCTLSHSFETYIQKICLFTIELMKIQINSYLHTIVNVKEKVYYFLAGSYKINFQKFYDEAALFDEIKRLLELI